jgi:DNA polymerase-4
MGEPTARTSTLLKVAQGLLAAAGGLIAQRGLTLIGVALTNLCDLEAVQLGLPFDRSGTLDAAVDSVRQRFGSGAISRAILLGREEGPWVPLLPD